MNKRSFINPRYLIALVFFALISAWLSYDIYRSSSSLYLEAENSITQLQKKRKSVTGMMRAARERLILLLNMYIEDDIFNRDQIKMQMVELAQQFLKNKEDFKSANLSDIEKTAFEDVMVLVNANAPLQLQVADLMVNDEMKTANKLLFMQAIPRQQVVLEKFDNILVLIEENVSREIQGLKTLQSSTNKYILQLIILMLAGVSISFFSIYSRTKSRESELKKLVAERTQSLEQAHSQVQSLIDNSSDGIISIDVNQRIVLFNPAAEYIFKYKKEDALGRPLSILLPDSAHEDHYKHVSTFGEFKDAESRFMKSRSEIKGKRKDGSLFDAEASISKSLIGGVTNYTAFVRDVTERKKAEEEIRRLAMYDSLTGLANRHHFETVLKNAIAYTRRFPENKLGLMLLDLDLFKQVNDNYGHAIGDTLLIHIAKILKNSVRDTDTVSRFGGDEFAILLKGIETSEQVTRVAEKLIDVLSKPHHIEGYDIKIGVSIGITFYPECADDSEQLFRQADMMMYKAKDAGRNTYRIYSKADVVT